MFAKINAAVPDAVPDPKRLKLEEARCKEAAESEKTRNNISTQRLFIYERCYK